MMRTSPFALLLSACLVSMAQAAPTKTDVPYATVGDVRLLLDLYLPAAKNPPIISAACSAA